MSGLVRNCNCDVNIVTAKVNKIGDALFGQMILDLPEDASVRERALEYLDDRGIVYETGREE